MLYCACANQRLNSVFTHREAIPFSTNSGRAGAVSTGGLNPPQTCFFLQKELLLYQVCTIFHTRHRGIWQDISLVHYISFTFGS